MFKRRIAINVLIDLGLQRGKLAFEECERLGNGVGHQCRGVECVFSRRFYSR